MVSMLKNFFNLQGNKQERLHLASFFALM